jgi:hypothetical protein
LDTSLLKDSAQKSGDDSQGIMSSSKPRSRAKSAPFPVDLAASRIGSIS